MIKPIELVIFDCDGVPVDSERITARVQVALGAELGWTPTEQDVVERFIGRSSASIREQGVARAAGMRAFGYAGGLTRAAWLEGPDTVVFDDMRALPALIAEHGR